MSGILPIAFLVWLIPHPTAAQGMGIRAGVSIDPDQFFLGGHLETDPLVDRLSFRPNLELGVGDDLTLFSVNFEFVYRMPVPDRPWALYVGGGPAVNIFAFDGGPDGDRPGRARIGRDDTEVEGGFNLVVGAQHTGGLFTELKVGALDSPDLKFSVGYVF